MLDIRHASINWLEKSVYSVFGFCSDYISLGLNALVQSSFIINKAGEIIYLFIWVYRKPPYICAVL